MKTITISLVLFICISCTQTSNAVNDKLLERFEITGSYRNHCAGVNVPMCRRFVKGVYVDRTKKYQKEGVKFIGESILKSLLGG
jgi:hypothetical protein